jgi:SET domain-containing protein
MKEFDYCYLAPQIESRPQPETGGAGVFALEPIPAGTLLMVWGGRIVDLETLHTLPPLTQSHAVQIEEGFYLATVGEAEPADYVNHCCDPNAGLAGQISLVALRDIAPGEEICFDYAMSDGTPYDEFSCGCGAAICRGQVTGDDWRIPELWTRYAGHFSPYLQRRIDRLQAK